jgi:hypothetical protein
MSEFEFECEIDLTEWEAVTQKILPFCAEDERFGSGQLVLRSSDSVRTWWSTDGRVVAKLEVGSAERDFLWTISPRLLAAWHLAAGGTGSAKICVTERESSNEISIRGAGGSFSLPWRDLRYPGLSTLAEEYDQADGGSAIVEAEGFYNLASLLKTAPAGPFLDDDRPVPPCILRVGDNSLTAEVFWQELGENVHHLTAETTGEAAVSCSPVRLHTVVKALEPGELTVFLPLETADGVEPPIRLEQGPLTVYLLAAGFEIPLDNWQLNTVEPVLEECFGSAVLVVDESGDYELSDYGAPVYARVLLGDPTRLCIFATVVEEIEQTPELLAELNDLNKGYGFVKLLWQDGEVLVAGDLVAETIDAPEVQALYERVRFVASEISPTLAAVHGGVAAEPIELARWDAYTRTAVLAELTQGNFVDLSGPEAVEEWPFLGPVHALTAWNPFGRRRGEVLNQFKTSELAGRLIFAGGSVVRSDGRSFEGDYGEGGLLVWGLETDTVRRIAGEFRQEAVFRIDADTLEVLAVFNDFVSSRPRLEHRRALEELTEGLAVDEFDSGSES